MNIFVFGKCSSLCVWSHNERKTTYNHFLLPYPSVSNSLINKSMSVYKVRLNLKTNNEGVQHFRFGCTILKQVSHAVKQSEFAESFLYKLYTCNLIWTFTILYLFLEQWLWRQLFPLRQWGVYCIRTSNRNRIIIQSLSLEKSQCVWSIFAEIWIVQSLKWGTLTKLCITPLCSVGVVYKWLTLVSICSVSLGFPPEHFPYWNYRVVSQRKTTSTHRVLELSFAISTEVPPWKRNDRVLGLVRDIESDNNLSHEKIVYGVYYNGWFVPRCL